MTIFKWRRFYGWLLLPLAVVALASYFFKENTASPEGTPNIGVVKRTDLLQNVTLAGTVIPIRRTVFSAPYNAYIKKIFVTLGQKVKRGDPVVSLEQSLGSVHETNFPMRAPFEGTVVQILHREGEYIESGKDSNGIVRIDDLSRLFVMASVPETEVERIRLGLPVLIKPNSASDRVYHGMVREIFLAAIDRNQDGRSGERSEFQIKLEITDFDASLKPGMTTIIDIITEKKEQVLTLPHEYVLEQKDKVWVTLENGMQRVIKIGSQNDELFEIIDGLKEGDRVRIVDFTSIKSKES